MKGIFTISLDFELHWGGFEKWPLEVSSFNFPRLSEAALSHRGLRQGSRGKDAGQKYLLVNRKDYVNYFLNTRQVIPEMLRLFAEHEVHVTWATVGMLFHSTKEQLVANAPDLKPHYTERKLSAYNYIQEHGIGEDEVSDPFHFAPSLIRQILITPHQEVATHTFAHYYCNENGQSIEQFRADLKAAQSSAALFGCKLTSLVFPRNQFNDQYLQVCFEEGITAVRSNPLDWFWQIDSTQNESLWKRFNRGVDAYFPLGKMNTYRMESLTHRDGYPTSIPASRLLRPFRPQELFLNRLKINRIKAEMTRAAQHGEIYHLWWHPHNFGAYPEESLSGLTDILRHYSDCRQKHRMQSMNMGEIAYPSDL